MAKKHLKDSTFDFNNLEIGTQLYQKTPVFYHWSNCSVGTKFLQFSAKQHSELDTTINDVWLKIQQLKDVSIWLKSGDHIIPMNMFDVYATVMTHLRKSNQDDNLFNGHEISFIGPSGPYKHTTLVQLINKTLYQDFLYFYLIKNKLPLRQFRLFVEGNVVVQYGNGHRYSGVLKVKQLTDNGILFSTKDDDFVQKVDHCDKVKFIALTDHLSELITSPDEGGKSLKNNDLFFTTDSMQFFTVEADKIIKSLSFDSGISGDFFLFCRYCDMKESNFPDVTKKFIEQSKLKIFKDVA